MRFNKTMIILAILVMVWTLGTPLGLQGKNHHNGADVDAIYQSIKNSGPVYEWDESIVTFENEGMTVVCSLMIPRTRHLAPIVFTLNGFAGTRDDIIVPGTDEPAFKMVSRLLAEQGIASLRIDFRGQGDSDGDYTFTTFSTQVSDTIAAIDYIEANLKHQVNTKSIGILGLSQGGLVGCITAARDNRVDSLVLWSPVANPPHCYQGLLLEEGIKQGLALPDGGSDVFGLYINGQYINWDVPLGKGFFEDIFNVDPLAEIRNYKKPLMVVVGKNDIIVWPQPAKGQLYMTYHHGYERLLEMDAGHGFAVEEEYEDIIYWGTAWFIKTLKTKKNKG